MISVPFVNNSLRFRMVTAVCGRSGLRHEKAMWHGATGVVRPELLCRACGRQINDHIAVGEIAQFHELGRRRE